MEQRDSAAVHECHFVSKKRAAAVTHRAGSRNIHYRTLQAWCSIYGVVSNAVRRFTAAKRVSIPLLGCWLAAWVFPALAMGTEAGVSSAVAPILQSEEPRAGHPETPLAAELLSLIKQLDPLRVTIPYVDYHDEALAAQTMRRKLQRRSGFKRSRARRNSFKASSGWTVKGSSVAGARGRSRSSRR